MNCEFIDKYADKLYTEEMGFFDSRTLNNHMNSCDECRSVYEKIIEGNRIISEALQSEEVPAYMASNILKATEESRHIKRRMYNFRKYLTAAAIFIVVAVSSFYLLPRYLDTNSPAQPGGVTPTPGQSGNVKDYPYSVEEFEKVLGEYLIKNMGYTSKGGQVFAAVDIFGVEGSGQSADVYLWALIEEYAWVQGLTPGTGSSIPIAIRLQKEDESYKPVSHRVPGDGTSYAEDIKIIFPEKYQQMVLNFHGESGKMDALMNQNKLAAMEYYKEYHTPQTTKTIDASIEKLLSLYGWHQEGDKYTLKITLPETFVDKPGEFPVGLYFAYNRVLSRDVGLDFSLYMGRDVTAHIIPLKEEFGDRPNRKIRAVVLEYNEKIVGVWLDRGRHYSFLASLDGDYFADIVKKPWGEWMKGEGLVDYTENGYEGNLKQLSPEDVLRKYYEAINNKDYKTAYSLLSKANQSGYLAANMDDSMLYNEGWDPLGFGLSNITSAEVIKIEPYGTDFAINPDKLLNRDVSEAKMLYVETDMIYKENIVRDNGSNPWFIIMVKETPDAPWLIDGINSGP